MREIILGTAGHVDHGKTSLIRALTGIDTDRLKEEKERGITIELGFAYLDLPCGHRIGIVDVPGHEKFVRNMVAGAAGMDLVAFIIAADEGIMPQTTEHFEICQLLGIKDGIIVLTKKDLVEEEWLDMVQEDIREYFSGTFLENAPILPVSSVSGEGIETVRETIDNRISKIAFQEEFGPFRLAVDRVFSMKGFGTVITGSSLSGRVGVGEELEFYPAEVKAKVRGIQVHGQDVDLVEAGHRTAINLQGVEKERINRGDIAATPGSLVNSTLLDVDFLYLASNPRKLKNRTQVRVHVGTREITGRVVFMETDEVNPGETAYIQLILQEPAAVWPGDRYVIRSYSPVRTIGGGTILNNAPLKRKRATEKDREANQRIFATYMEGSDIDRLLLFLEESGVAGLTQNQLAIRLGIFGNKLKKLLQNPVSSGDILVIDSERQRLLAAPVLQQLTEKITGILESYHASHPLMSGLAKEELKSGIRPPVDQKLFQFALDSMVKKKIIVQDQAEVRMANFEVSLQVDEQELKEKIFKIYRDAGLSPPNFKEVVGSVDNLPEKQVRQVVNLLLHDNQLIKVNESLYFDAGQINELGGRITGYIKEHGEIDAPRFKELTGLTRKFSIPLLEYFDKIKLTIRIGDKRVLRKEIR
ncbi:MAG: selenocysteine-specific translation elongation factor [Desulfobulbaceae bacterium]|nr:selenocysteine-specific translation elongation factor [Desulfobulbaceae bacterium]